MTKLNLIFAGTSEFAVCALEALIHSEHRVLAVYTPPDRPAGRGLKLTASPIKQLAMRYGLPICQPATLKDPDTQALLKTWGADIMVVAAYGLLLPEAVLNMFPLGCINIHPSLLPRWRGAAPIVRTLECGDIQTGITIMQLDKGLDTGPIWMQAVYDVAENETSQSLYEKLSPLSAELLLKTMTRITENKAAPIPQSEIGVTYAEKIEKSEARLDWSLPAITLERKVRAFNPWPIAHTTWENTLLKIWEAKAESYQPDEHDFDRGHTVAGHDLPFGMVSGLHLNGIDVHTGQGILHISKIQLAGGKPMKVCDFLSGSGKTIVPKETLFS